MVVFDASVTLAWIFERADAVEADRAMALLASLDERPAIVPELWHTEVTNAVAMGHRRGIISLSKATDFLTRLDRLPIQTDASSAAARKLHLFALACEYRLTAYDASYLELALRYGAALATFDRGLAEAQREAGVPSA